MSARRETAAARTLDVHAHVVAPTLLEAVRAEPHRFGARLEPNEQGAERLTFEDGRAIRPGLPKAAPDGPPAGRYGRGWS